MRTVLTVVLTFGFIVLWAQHKPIPVKSNPALPKTETEHLQIKRLSRFGQTEEKTGVELHYDQLPKLDLKQRMPISGPIIVHDEQSHLPIYIEGEVKGLPELRDAPEGQKGLQYLNYFKRELHINAPDQEFVLTNKSLDDLGQTHWRFRQHYHGIEVYGAEVILHEKESKINGLNGRYFATPKLASLEAKVEASSAVQLALQDLAQKTKVRPLEPAEVEMVGAQVAKKQLVIYHTGTDQKQAVLCWYLEVVPNLHGRWAYFIDAEHGTILKNYSLLCKIHHHPTQSRSEPVHFHTYQSIAEAQGHAAMPPLDGKATAVAKDLAGANQTINTYQIGSSFFMIDASKDMFNPTASSLPQDPKGAIVTLDVRNTIDADGNFKAFFFTSSNNTWNAPNAVSAHVNAGLVYDYFRQTFGRKSINNAGITMRSYVNVPDEDGNSLENAYWNGDAMFYGNGGKELRSLAQSLDIAGHEITHGIIQNTANLDYEGESGALNESFADIFGAMIDRNDWKIGEDVVLPSAFPSGALRDLSNPNNGGRSLRDPGWQPAHYSERYTGTEDEGGVHINSGIVNRAFFLFATQVGKEMAERVYYTVLSNYLTRSSRFVDARLAVMRAAREKGGDSAVKAAESAFETVGIRGSTPTAPPTDLKINPGTQYILGVKADRKGLGIFDVNKRTVLELPIPTGVLQKPSVSDDGSLVIFINGRKELKYLELDWARAQFDTGTLNSNRIWENVSISRDGQRLAALLTNRKDEIAVVDLILETNNIKYFQLYNPTYTQGVSSGNVVGADALEWDLNSEAVVYDAYNEVQLSGFGTYNYWDMGLLNAWNKKTKTFGDGKIEKIFNGLEEGENIGNPSFSKNTPYILSFDYIVDQNGNGQVDDSDEYAVLSTNLETGDIATVFDNTTLGFPNYATKDDFMLFNAENTQGDEVIAIVPLKTDKLSANGAASIFKSGYIMGTWFATGQRILSNNRNASWPEAQVKIYPNPFGDQTLLELNLTEREILSLEISDVYGRVLYQKRLEAGLGKVQLPLDLKELPAGQYVLRIHAGLKSTTRKLIKR